MFSFSHNVHLSFVLCLFLASQLRMYLEQDQMLDTTRYVFAGTGSGWTAAVWGRAMTTATPLTMTRQSSPVWIIMLMMNQGAICSEISLLSSNVNCLFIVLSINISDVLEVCLNSVLHVYAKLVVSLIIDICKSR